MYIMKNIKKSHWAIIIYPESAPPNWREILQDTGLEVAISPIHDQDINPDNTKKKPHYHVILNYSNNTTFLKAELLLDKKVSNTFFNKE